MTFSSARPLAISVLLLAAAGHANADDAACSAQLEHYLALNNAPTQTSISGVAQVGPSADELATISQEKGPCEAWNTVVRSMMRQHGQVLDGVEQMTGKPAPKR